MKKIFPAFIFLIAFLVVKSTSVYCQNVIEPTRSFYQDSSPYHRALLKNLMGVESVCPEFAVLCVPTHMPEWYLHCEIGETKLNLAIADENIGSKIDLISPKKKIKSKMSKICKYEMNIDNEQKNILDSFFIYSTAVSCIDVDSKMAKFDGVGYIFMSKLVSGWCVSPRYGNVADLVDVAYKLRDIVKGGDQRGLQNIIPEIQRLTDTFRSLYYKIKELTTESTQIKLHVQ